jgi:SAM-dependent methyltransferase/uncharacterized protein YbaR (Trm112 family)
MTCMRRSLLGILRCPIDLSLLKINSKKEVGGHVITGQLQCTVCQQVYPITQGVPDLLPSGSVSVGGNDLTELQTATVERFGFEWRYFLDWGWLETYPNVPNAKEKFYGGLIEHTQRAFWSKSLFHENELYPGLLVLDAGCGNGRFTNEAARTGAEVVGVDLGWGVYSAFEHTHHLPNVHIVRGDIFRLPFGDATFDRVFSIGVLQHTGNAEQALKSLARTVKPGGLLVAHVYGRGRLSYELLDSLVRGITTRLPIVWQLRFAQGTAAIARWLRSGGKWRVRFYQRLFSFMNLLPTQIHMFDWWSAPIATHHEFDEVIGWFDKLGFEVVRTNPPLTEDYSDQPRRRMHRPITVLGQRPQNPKG